MRYAFAFLTTIAMACGNGGSSSASSDPGGASTNPDGGSNGASDGNGGGGGPASAPAMHHVTVLVTGDGTVRSEPAGIDCPVKCAADFSEGTHLIFTATPGPNSYFSRFTGACSGAACDLRVTADELIAARFVPPGVLRVDIAGPGGGHILSSPPGIDCRSSCTASFAPGTSVTLNAAPDLVSAAPAWTGACTGAGCTIALTADAHAVANFPYRRHVAHDMGVTTGSSYTRGGAISPNGKYITGPTYTTTYAPYFGWSAGMLAIGIEDGVSQGINDSGTIVGFVGSHAFVWTFAGGRTDLYVPDQTMSMALAVNAQGLVAGTVSYRSTFRGGYWNAGGFVDFGSLDGECSEASGINSQGVMVGASCYVPGEPNRWRAVRFRAPGVIDDLGILPGGKQSWAFAINDSGVIVGASETADDTHGFYYSDGRMLDIGLPPGMTYARLAAVNSSGVAVGMAFNSTTGIPIIYGAGHLIDVNSILVPNGNLPFEVHGIDDRAGIIATGFVPSGETHALLLIPQ